MENSNLTEWNRSLKRESAIQVPEEDQLCRKTDAIPIQNTRGEHSRPKDTEVEAAGGPAAQGHSQRHHGCEASHATGDSVSERKLNCRIL